MNFLASIIGKLAIELLKWLSARHDLKESVRKGITLEAKKLEIRALLWKSKNPVVIPSDVGADFTVEPSGVQSSQDEPKFSPGYPGPSKPK